MNKVHGPLSADHPLVVDGDVCSLCKEPFCAGERTILLTPNVGLNGIVQGAPAHARCALRGLKTPHGEITNIKDGDGSPFVVETDGGSNGHQWTFSEVSIKGE